MTVSPYITEALERAKLPIEVWYAPLLGKFQVRSLTPLPRKKYPRAFWTSSPIKATCAYLDLVSTLETTGSTSPVEPAADCSASVSPDGVR